MLIAGNWKMFKGPREAQEFFEGFDAPAGVDAVFCPPFVSLAAVRDALATGDVAAPDGRVVDVGAQDVHHEPAGAFTGAISAPMLEGLATWAIVGHSERRRDACETDELIGRKLLAARAGQLHVILCVGEQLAERDAGRALEVVDRQVRACLASADPGTLVGATGGDAAAPLTIAYEPVWAIGTGRNARGPDAAEMADAIRTSLLGLGWGDRGAETPVLYGGSVTSANIGAFLAEPSIDGALVGGASLKPDEMAGIVARAGITARARGHGD
jgi:triosephosphate isomerase